MIFAKCYEQMCELQHFLDNWMDLKLPSLKVKKLYFFVVWSMFLKINRKNYLLIHRATGVSIRCFVE